MIEQKRKRVASVDQWIITPGLGPLRVTNDRSSSTCLIISSDARARGDGDWAVLLEKCPRLKFGSAAVTYSVGMTAAALINHQDAARSINHVSIV